MLRSLLLSTALVAGVGTAASAATISDTATLGALATNFSGETASVDQFDSSLGTLNSVTIELFGNVSGTFQYESQDGSPATVNMNLSAEVGLSTAGLGEFLVALPTLSQTFNTTAFDGSIDFAGTSGGTVTGLNSSDDETTTLLGGDMSEFIGLGTIDLFVSGVGLSSASGPGNLFQGFSTLAGASVTVTYDYTEATTPPPSPVPLPAGMPLMLVGLAALGIAKRRKG